MANLPGSIKNLNTLLGEQLLDGEGGGGGGISNAEVTIATSGGTGGYSIDFNLCQEDNFNYTTGVYIDSDSGYSAIAQTFEAVEEPQIKTFVIMPSKYIIAFCPPQTGVSDYIVTGDAEVASVTAEGQTLKVVKIYGSCNITVVAP